MAITRRERRELDHISARQLRSGRRLHTLLATPPSVRGPGHARKTRQLRSLMVPRAEIRRGTIHDLPVQGSAAAVEIIDASNSASWCSSLPKDMALSVDRGHSKKSTEDHDPFSHQQLSDTPKSPALVHHRGSPLILDSIRDRLILWTYLSAGQLGRAGITQQDIDQAIDFEMELRLSVQIEQNQDNIAPRPVPEEAINFLPKKMVGNDGKVKCSICLRDVESRIEIIDFSICWFHEDCIRDWLKKHNLLSISPGI
jgi:hypothetical protein